VGVDDPELDVLGDEILLHLAGQAVPHLLGAVRAVEQERRPALGPGQDRHPLQEPELVAGDEVGLVDEVGRADRLGPEAQVGHGHRPRLLGVVDEVTLGPQVGALADDLHRRLVRPHRAVGAEAEEHGLHLALGPRGPELGVDVQAEAGDVVVDAYREVPLRPLPGRLVQDGLDHRRGELLRRQAVAPADHPGPSREQGGVAVAGLVERRHHIEVQRLARRARLLGPVQHRDGAHGRGQGRHQLLGRERPVQAHLEQAHRLARRRQDLDRLLCGARGRAHQDHHPLGIRRPDVVDQPVAPAGARREPVHGVLHDPGHGEVVGVGRLPRLEEHVGVLGRPSQDRRVRRHGPRPEGEDVVLGDQRPQVVVSQHRDLVDLVGRAEPVEEVQERHPGAQARGVGHQGQVVRLLDGAGGEHRPPRGAGVHHVAVVPEDRQGVGGDRPGRHVDHDRGQLAGDLEHVGDHQQQALR
jgi:hypothetical protein